MLTFLYYSLKILSHWHRIFYDVAFEFLSTCCFTIFLEKTFQLSLQKNSSQYTWMEIIITILTFYLLKLYNPQQLWGKPLVYKQNWNVHSKILKTSLVDRQNSKNSSDVDVRLSQRHPPIVRLILNILLTSLLCQSCPASQTPNSLSRINEGLLQHTNIV